MTKDRLSKAIDAIKDQNNTPQVPKDLIESTKAKLNAAAETSFQPNRTRLFIKLTAAAVILLVSIVTVSIYTNQNEQSAPYNIAKTSNNPKTIAPAPKDAANKNLSLDTSPESQTRVDKLIAGNDYQTLAKLLASADPAARAKYIEYFASLPEAQAMAILAALSNLTEAQQDQNSPADTTKILTLASDPNRLDAAATSPTDDTPPPEEENVINIRVINKETGLPLEGVKISARGSKKTVEKQYFTDRSGWARITLTKTITKFLELKVSKNLFTPAKLGFGNSFEKEVPKSCTVHLIPATVIGGIVKNEQGQPIEGATIIFSTPRFKNDADKPENVTLRNERAKTDPNGQWRYNKMPPNVEYVPFRAEHPNYVKENSYQGANIDELLTFKNVVILKKGIHLAGRVLDTDKKPIANANLLMGDSRYASNKAETQSDEQGYFKFVSASPERAVITVEAEGFAPDLIEFAPGPNSAPVEFLLEESFAVRGQVIDVNGDPIPLASLSADEWRGYRTLKWNTKTDEKGNFEWIGAPGDEVLFDFYKKKYMSTRNVPISPELRNHIIVMNPPLIISGSITDADTNEPISEYKIIEGTDWGNEGQPIYWTTREEMRNAVVEPGKYRATFTEPRKDGGHLIKIQSAGYLPAVSRTFKDDEGTLVQNFKLEKGTGPSGFVFASDGAPSPDTEVIICIPGNTLSLDNGKNNRRNDTQYVTTDSGGAFSMPPQTTRFALVVLSEAGYAEVNDTEFAADANIYLDPWGAVEGNIYVGQDPGVGETVAINYNTPYNPDREAPRIYYNYKTTADANGYFHFDRVKPGSAKVSRSIKLSQYSSGYSNAEPVEVIPGQTVYVKIGGNGLIVTGKVVAPAHYTEPINFSIGHSSMTSQTHKSLSLSPKLPDNFQSMSHYDQMQWYKNWLHSDETKPLRDAGLLPLFTDEFFEMTEQEQMEWQKEWPQSDEGKAYMAKIQKYSQEISKDQRSYAVPIKPDGTFRIDDVLPGTYRLYIHVREKDQGPYNNMSGEMIGSLNHNFQVPEPNDDFPDNSFDIGSLTLGIQKKIKAGDIAPDLQLLDPNGNTRSLSEFAGKVRLLVFWASHNSNADTTMQQLKHIFDSFADQQDFEMFYISYAPEEVTKKYAEDNRLEKAMYITTPQARQTVSNEYGLTSYPLTILIDKEGVVLSRNQTDYQLKTQITTALEN